MLYSIPGLSSSKYLVSSTQGHRKLCHVKYLWKQNLKNSRPEHALQSSARNIFLTLAIYNQDLELRK